MTAYDDIINMPYKKSVRHPHMDMINRAAQFAPFAALTGFEGAIDEAKRLTEAGFELTDEIREEMENM